MPIGQTNTVAVTVTNISNDTVQLVFLGLRFEWSSPNSFFIGGNSEKGAVLAPGEQIAYSIAVTVPSNVTPGVHRLTGYVTYRVSAKGNWTGVLAGWWVTDIPFAYPQTQQPQPPPTTGQAPSVLSTHPETVGVLVVVVIIGLLLERGRIIRLVRRRSTELGAEPTKPETEKPVEKAAGTVKKEEDV